MAVAPAAGSPFARTFAVRLILLGSVCRRPFGVDIVVKTWAAHQVVFCAKLPELAVRDRYPLVGAVGNPLLVKLDELGVIVDTKLKPPLEPDQPRAETVLKSFKYRVV